MIEMVTKISQAEEAAGLVKKEAQQRAMQMEAEAHRVGKAQISELRAKNEAQGAKLLEDTQEEATKLGGEGLNDARDESRTVSASASTRIGTAASLIVERIVDTK